MMAQIEWYEEILALEPGSKVFFPFAKRLESEGLRGKALNVLRQGLAQHPEYMEARVLLAHLLQASGETETAAAEAGAVFARLCEYPEFWIAAGTAQLAQSARQPAAEDVALLLNMLAENARNSGQSFASLMRGACGPARSPQTVKPSSALGANAEEAMKTAVIAVEKAAEKAAEEAVEEASERLEEAAFDAAAEIAEEVTAALEDEQADRPCAAPADEVSVESADSEDIPAETVDGIPVTAAEVIIHAVEQELYDRPVDEVLHTEMIVSGNGSGESEKLTGEQFSLLIAEKIIQASDRKEGHPDELLDLPEDLSAESEQDDLTPDFADDPADDPTGNDLQDLGHDEIEAGDADIQDALVMDDADAAVRVDAEDLDALLASLPEPPEVSEDIEALTAQDSVAEDNIDEIILDDIVPFEADPAIEVVPDAPAALDFDVEPVASTEEIVEEAGEESAAELAGVPTGKFTEEPVEELDDEPVRTRSMADVLAEQGDIEGALAIYSELLHSAQPEEAEVLKQRMLDLSGEQSNNAEQSASVASKSEKIDKTARADNAGLRKMLESLAGRLEKRARS